MSDSERPAAARAPVLGGQPRRPGVVLSAIIATHNRRAALERCLAALGPQADRADVEVILVDSGSEPAAAAHARALAGRWGFTLIRLDEPGVSRARNEGAAAASGAWFATLDDDAVPAPGWVAGALATLRAVPPDAGIIQGRVEPLWEEEGRGDQAERADLEPLHARFLSIVRYDADHEWTGPAHCAGANMLVNRALHARIGGYGLQFGRVGQTLVSGIDTDLVDRMRRGGARIYYANAFPVLHAVGAQRMTRAWVRERSLEEGRAQGRIIFARRGPVRQAAQVAKSLAALALLGVAARLRPRSFDLMIRVFVNRGLMEQAPLIGGVWRAWSRRTDARRRAA